MNSGKYINEMRGTPGTSIWQRNYYEHIIRNEDDLLDIREYILHNPKRWVEDENNPVNLTNVGATGRSPLQRSPYKEDDPHEEAN